jgi:hypothetical protein
MGERGAQALQDRFNWPNVVGRVEGAYANALERVRGRRPISSPVE